MKTVANRRVRERLSRFYGEYGEGSGESDDGGEKNALRMGAEYADAISLCPGPTLYASTD